MQVSCNHRDRIFEDGTLAEWAALEAHAATCPLCAEEVRAWKSLSVAAGELRDYSDSPSLWPDRTRTGRRSGAKSAARRAQGLVLVPAKPFACMASGPGRRVGSDADALRGPDLSSPSSQRARYRRSITSKEQGPQRGGKRGNGLPAVD